MTDDEKKLKANIPPFGLRMQPALKARIEAAASANNRSMNAEIVARLEASQDRDPVETIWRRSYPDIELTDGDVAQLRDELGRLMAEYRESMRQTAAHTFKGWLAKIAAETDDVKRAELLRQANAAAESFTFARRGGTAGGKLEFYDNHGLVGMRESKKPEDSE